MSKSKKITDLYKLLRKNYFTAKEARECGVQPALLNYYIKIGKLKRLYRGMYQEVGFNYPPEIFQWEDLIEAVQSVPNGVVCLISALDIHDITEEIPRRHWIAIPHDRTIKRRGLVQIVKFRNPELGKIEINLHGIRIPIYDRERTIIDSFRLLSRETAIKALKFALEASDRPINLIKLQDYAKELRFNIAPYLETATT
jgi:predicted transcriptional regulator of viral defense system